MPRFLSRYTPHDSYWIGLYLQPKTDAVALVRWDTYWTDGGLPSAGDAVAGWPVLLVRFERVYQTFTAYPGPEERETLSGLPETIAGATISPVHRSWVEIWHGGNTRFLCLDANGETIPIPDLR